MKNRLFVFFLLLSNTSFSQLANGIPFNFCGLNGIQYNPGIHPEGSTNYSNMWVTTDEDEELSKCEIIYLKKCFEDDYPNHTIIGPPTCSYNCHGYSFSVTQGEDTCNICWYQELCSNSFIQVTTPQKGDIAVVRDYTDPTHTDFVPLSQHSSVVVNQDTLISKWRDGPLTKHHKDDVIDLPGLANGSSVYTYYRRITNTSTQITGPDIIDGTGTYTFRTDVVPTTCTWSVEPAAMFQNASGSGKIANLSYAIPFVHLAPKATITFTFSYGCDNHYTATKEIDLRIPTTTISGIAESDGFVLADNAVVTVTGEIRSNPKAITIVPNGTRLILNGGTMTSNGTSMWSGIQVWGNSSTHQYEVNGSYGQGYLELKNGAAIENAENAVVLWHPEHYNTTGGIIHASDASFHNNGVALRALYYTNYIPGTNNSTVYNSYFKNCSFVIDTDYIGTTTFHKHIDIAYVDGIKFFGCAFSANRSATNVSYWCNGIRANQASVLVNSYCSSGEALPCSGNLIRSSFLGFYHGIYGAYDGNGTESFSVRNSDFYNNDCGIYLLNAHLATILSNNFTIGNNAAECAFGIYADHVSGFCIEENTFCPKTNTTCTTYGIDVVNSCSSNEIHRNQFSGLACANVAVGQNIRLTGNVLPASPTGLAYSCNDNTSGSANTIDFCVLDDNSVTYSGIQGAQGSLVLPAGNTFGGVLYHFYNDGDYSINYYYNQNQSYQIPNSTKTNYMSLYGTTNTNSCPAHYGNIVPVHKSEQEKAELASNYLAAHSAYNNLRQLYESRIDGGSTPTEVSDIANATPSDMWQLRAQLLGHSPYLSQEVLTAAADREDVFTDPVLFEILSANPDELKKDTLISYLESKNRPLPDYMIGLLRQIANGATARTALEAQMAKYGHDFRLAAGDIVRSNLCDSIANPTELRTWLAAMEDIAADRLVVASFMEEGNYTDAFTLADMLPDLYGLEGDALADHTDYMRLLGLYRTLGISGRSVFEMTEEETEMVESIADEGMGTSKAMAEALLSNTMNDWGNRTYFCPELPDSKGGNRGDNGYISGKDYTGILMNEAMGFKINVSPSPATTWTTVDYTLPIGAEKATLTLTSTLGIKVMDVELGGNSGSKVLDLRGLSAGVYRYTIRCGGYVEAGKLVITK